MIWTPSISTPRLTSICQLAVSGLKGDLLWDVNVVSAPRVSLENKPDTAAVGGENLLLANFTFSSDHWKASQKLSYHFLNFFRFCEIHTFVPRIYMELTKGFGTKAKHQISSRLGLGDDLGLHSW